MKKTTIPKICHLYWGKDKPLSWLRWLTVKSFAMLNPDWRVIVWHPDRPGQPPKWRTREHSFYAWAGEDWFNRLSEAGANVEVREAPIKDFPPMSEVHRSDLLRWWLLHEMGGFWSDIDIVYYRSMSDIRLDMEADALLCWGEIEELKNWQAIGFLAGKQGSQLFKQMFDTGLVLARLPNLGYQDLGTDLLMRFARPGDVKAVGSRIGQIPQHVVYPFNSVRGQMQALWGHNQSMDIRPDTIGVHWFAAQRQSCAKESQWQGFQDVSRERTCGGVRWAMQNSGLIEPFDELAKEYSIIMPYLDRPVLLHNTLVSYYHWYGARNDWELVLVQDSKCRQVSELNNVVSEWRKKGLEIRLVFQEAAKIDGPSVLYNRGVEESRGRYMILTSPEIYHDTDILSGLDRLFGEVPDQYVVCACQSRGKLRGLVKVSRFGELRGRAEKWVQHSIHRPAMYHFCSALPKDRYLEAGGFDEDFAKGFCFDDDDFRDTVKKVGITIIQADHLLTSHQYHDPRHVSNKMEKWNLNKALYESKHGLYNHIPPEKDVVMPLPSTVNFGPGVAVLCVLRSGGYFTEEYVARLKAMVTRNTTVNHKFICLTDVPGVEGSIALDDDLPGWWSKIELFRPGLVKAERIVYFDLDTIIRGNINDLLRLEADFYGLRPWNRANRLNGQFGSGIMAWRNGAFDFIYREFNKVQIAPHEGDQAYISRSLIRRDINYRPLQDAVPGIYSYKRECRSGLPRDARIICFHGRPRVHECKDKWVVEAWG